MNSSSVRGTLAVGLVARGGFVGAAGFFVGGSPFRRAALRGSCRRGLRRGAIFGAVFLAFAVFAFAVPRGLGAHCSNSASRSATVAFGLPAEGRIGFPDAGVEDADVEAVVGHDPPRGARGVVGRRDRRRVRELLPVALVGAERDAGREHLDEREARDGGSPAR